MNLARQLDKAFPQRVHPDGWIADDNHTGTSSHHPDDTPGSKPEWDGDPDSLPDVRGLDVSSDLGPGVKALDVCRHIASLAGLRFVVRYFIHAGWIWHERNDFVPVRYTREDQHPTHIHFTFAFTEAADDNTTYDYRLQEVPVALTEADKVWFKTQIHEAVAATARATADVLVDIQTDGEGENWQPWSRVDAYARDERASIERKVDEALTILRKP